MSKNQINGRIKEVLGIATEVMGKVLGDKPRELKGKAQRAAGNVQANYGDRKESVKEGR